MNSDFSNFISEKIDSNTNIIWFEKSNKYIVLNDTINILLLNKLKPNEGSVKLGTKMEIAYFDQLREHLDMEKNLIKNY